jgi:hypothetical protein
VISLVYFLCIWEHLILIDISITYKKKKNIPSLTFLVPRDCFVGSITLIVSLFSQGLSRWPHFYIILIKVSLKVLFFAWLAALGKILIMDNLWKQRTIVVDWCCMRKKIGESFDHLLLYYEIASALWNSIFSLFGLDWVMPRRVVDLFTYWMEQFVSIHSATVWKIVPSCLMCVHLERKELLKHCDFVFFFMVASVAKSWVFFFVFLFIIHPDAIMVFILKKMSW